MDKITGAGYQGPVLAGYLTRIERERQAEVKTLVRAIDLLNKSDMSEDLGEGNSLDYSVDDKTGRPIIKVVQKDSGQVLFQIPPERVVELVAKQAKKR